MMMLDQSDVNKSLKNEDIISYLKIKKVNDDLIRRVSQSLSDDNEPASKDSGVSVNICDETNQLLTNNSSNTNDQNSEDKSPTNYQIYSLCYKKFLNWVFNSLDSYRDELYQVAFVLFIQFFFKLLKADPRKANLFLRRFGNAFRIYYEHEIEELLCINDPSQLVHCLFFKHRCIDPRYTIYISKRTKKFLQTYLLDCDSILIQNTIQCYIKFKVVDDPNDGSYYDTSDAEEHDCDEDSTKQNREERQDSDNVGERVNNIKIKDSLFDRILESNRERINHTKITWGLPKSLFEDSWIDDKKKEIKVIGDEPTELVGANKLIPLPDDGSDVHFFYKNLLKSQASRRAYVSKGNYPSVLCYTLHNNCQLCSLSISTFDGMFLAASYDDSFIKLWNLASFELCKMRGIMDENSEDNSYVLNVLSYGNPEDWLNPVDLIGHEGPAYALCFGELNKILLSGGLSGVIHLWSLTSKNKVKALYRGGFDSIVWSIDMPQFGYYFASGESDRLCKFWCTERSHPIRTFSGHTSDVDKVKFHPNCSLLATASSIDKNIHIWDVRAAKIVRVFSTNDQSKCRKSSRISRKNISQIDSLQNIALSQNGRLLAAGGSNNNGLLWDISMGLQIGTLCNLNSKITDLDFSYGSNLLTTSSSDQKLKFFDISMAAKGESNATIRAMRNNKRPIYTHDSDYYYPSKVYGIRDSQINFCKYTAENVLLIGAVSVY